MCVCVYKQWLSCFMKKQLNQKITILKETKKEDETKSKTSKRHRNHPTNHIDRETTR